LSNAKLPTGIKLEKWTLPDKEFFEGKKNPKDCDRGATRETVEIQTVEVPSPGADAQFESAMRAGRLRRDEPDNAWRALEELRRGDAPPDPEHIAMLETRLLVALENRGQAVLVQYLKGDQEALKAEPFQNAALDFEAALRLSPGSQFDESRAKFCRGRALIYAQQYPQAIELLEQAIRLDPTGAYAYNALGIAYLEQVRTTIRNYQYATDAFQDAINRAPYWAYPRHNLALALTQRGEFPSAEAQYLAAIDLAPYYSYLPYNLGLLYQQIADFPQAKTYYEKAKTVATHRCELRLPKGFASCPERSLPDTGLAALEIRRGNRRNARRLLHAALVDDPANLTAAHNEATILADWRGHAGEAEALWTANLKTDPKHLPSLIGYSEMLSRQCRFAEAVPRYREVRELLKEYLPAQMGLARALVATGELTEADPLTAELVNLRPENAQAWAARAEYLARSDKDPAPAWRNALRLAKDRAERKQITERSKGRGCPLK
jgi:tetratricopeptide (TPR) repeat protein